MNKKELAILEMAYDCEVRHALKQRTIHVMQTKSSIAKKLAEDGFLKEVSMRIPGSPWPATVDGYELTHAGRLAYCASC